MTASPARCSDTARGRGDDPVGTAAPVLRWLLVEHPGPWEVDAWRGSRIAEPVRRALDQTARHVGGRILLIRRPGRRSQAAARSWAVLGDGVGSTDAYWGVWESDRDLLDAVAVLDGSTVPDGSSAARTADDAVLLVCAHGRHDTCCAVRGRPVASALQRFWPRQTWECTHVGGDRFAANLIVLPDGVYYGNLDPEAAVDVVRDHLDGRVCVPYLRGLSTEPPVAQVAIAEAHRRFGPAAARAFTSAAVVEVADDRWDVTVQGEPPCPPSLEVTVETYAREPALLTCRAERMTTAMAYRVTAVRP